MYSNPGDRSLCEGWSNFEDGLFHKTGVVEQEIDDDATSDRDEPLGGGQTGGGLVATGESTNANRIQTVLAYQVQT